MSSHLISIFITIFLAELGDKTAFATAFFASDSKNNPYLIFLASALALVFSCAIATFIGNMAGKYLETIPLKLISGICFLIFGALHIFEHFSK
ncbi:MAG: TMEM165/GDT1 family protein [Rickettsiales bacterium]|nr:TMEM165/GDT1 family protein [Rickettsiales bacterium]